jgi:hypothetical protein
MIRYSAADLAIRSPGLSCTDCEPEVAAAPPGETWVFHVNRYYCARCARNEGLY